MRKIVAAGVLVGMLMSGWWAFPASRLAGQGTTALDIGETAPPLYVMPQKVYILGMAIDGIITEYPHHVQHFVRHGDLLLKLYSEQVELNVELLDAQLELIREHDTKAAEIRRDFAKDNLDIVEKNFNKYIGGTRVAAEKEMKEASQASELAVLALEKVRIDAKVLDVRRRQQQDLLKQHSLTSPVDGVIVPFASVKELETLSLKKPEVGETVKAGAPVAAIMKLDRLRIEMNLPKSKLSSIRMGQAVKVYVETEPERAIEGKVVYISPTIIPEIGQFHIKVEFENPLIEGAELKAGPIYPYRFRPGLEARVVLP